MEFKIGKFTEGILKFIVRKTIIKLFLAYSFLLLYLNSDDTLSYFSWNAAISASTRLLYSSPLTSNSPLPIFYRCANESNSISSDSSISLLHPKNISDLCTSLYIFIFLPQGFEVSAIPRFTLTHYLHRSSGSGWYFDINSNILENENLAAKQQQ